MQRTQPLIGTYLSAFLYVQKQPLRVFYRKGVLMNSTKFTEKHLYQIFLVKEKTPTQVFSSEFCRTIKEDFLTEQLRVNDSVCLLISMSFSCNSQPKKKSWLYFLCTLATSSLYQHYQRHRPASLFKISVFHKCFANIFLAKANCLVST